MSTMKVVPAEEAYAKAVDKGGMEVLLKRAGFDPKTVALSAKQGNVPPPEGEAPLPDGGRRLAGWPIGLADVRRLLQG